MATKHRILVVLLFLILAGLIFASNVPRYLEQRTIAPKEYDQAEEQRYRDDIQKQLQKIRKDLDKLKGD